MKFSVSHSRGFVGQNITVTVAVENKESLRHIGIALDGFSIREADLVPGSSQYSEEFTGIGEASPGMEHELVVSATNEDMETHASTPVWTDRS